MEQSYSADASWAWINVFNNLVRGTILFWGYVCASIILGCWWIKDEVIQLSPLSNMGHVKLLKRLKGGAMINAPYIIENLIDVPVYYAN